MENMKDNKVKKTQVQQKNTTVQQMEKTKSIKETSFVLPKKSDTFVLPKKADTLAQPTIPTEPTFVVEERKPATPRKTRKKIENQTEEKTFVEFAGAKICIKDVVESAKNHYKAIFEQERGVGKTFSVYVKPEEGVAYYTVDGVGGDEYKVGI